MKTPLLLFLLFLINTSFCQQVHPKLLGRWKDGNCYDHLKYQDYLYFSNGANLMVANVSNPENPTIERKIPLENTISGGMTVSDERLYVSLSCGFVIFDISSPSNPAEINYYRDGCWSYDIEIYGDYLFHQKEIYDVSNPESVVSINGDFPFHYIEISGNILYSALASEGITIYNISDIQNPSEIAFIPVTGYLNNIKVYNNQLFILGEITSVYDISNPYSPINQTESNYTSYCMDIVDNFAFICNQYDEVFVYDVLQPDTLLEINNLILENNSSGIYQITIDENHFYVSSGMYGINIYETNKVGSKN